MAKKIRNTKTSLYDSMPKGLKKFIGLKDYIMQGTKLIVGQYSTNKHPWKTNIFAQDLKSAKEKSKQIAKTNNIINYTVKLKK